MWIWTVTEYYDWAIATQSFTNEAAAIRWAVAPYVELINEAHNTVSFNGESDAEHVTEAIEFGAYTPDEVMNICDAAGIGSIFNGRILQIDRRELL